MAWVRIEDAVTEHRKHLRAGPAACWLWVCGIAYCQRQLSDGFIPEEALTLLGVTKGAVKLAAVLVEVGLFERVHGGYLVHDYHDFNDTREEALQRRAEQHGAKVRAGVVGAKKRWQKDSSLLIADDSRGVADGNSRTIAPSHPIPSHPDPIPKKPAASSPAARKRPIYTSDRFAVFEWQLNELGRVLGPHVDEFDLHGFFDELTQKSRTDGLVIPKEDCWKWLQSQVLTEARKRGLPIATAEPLAPTNKRIAGLVAGGQAFLNRGQR